MPNDVRGAKFRAEMNKTLRVSLQSMRTEGSLCDITLVVDGKKFPCHKAILSSHSNYFQSMFRSGMRETRQQEVTIKGVSVKGMEKILDVLYKTCADLNGDDVFHLVSAAEYLQMYPISEYYATKVLDGISAANYHRYIKWAKDFIMESVEAKIDNFVMGNLVKIAKFGNLEHISSAMMIRFAISHDIIIDEVDLFRVCWQWIRLNPENEKHTVTLMNGIRFNQMKSTDLESVVLKEDGMRGNKELLDIIYSALSYHCVPFSQPLKTGSDMGMRSYKVAAVGFGGVNRNNAFNRISTKVTIIDPESDTDYHVQIPGTVPFALNFCQVVTINNFVFVLGGSSGDVTSMRGESEASVYRYDIRFNTWFLCQPLFMKRTFFYAGAIGTKILAVGGSSDGIPFPHCEIYDIAENKWKHVQELPVSLLGMAGLSYQNNVYITGGCSLELEAELRDNFSVYNEFTDIWLELERMNVPRAFHTMCQSDRKFYVFGGCNPQGMMTFFTYREIRDYVHATESYDLAVNQWTILKPSPSIWPMVNSSCVQLSEDKIYIIGGSSDHVGKDILRYSIAENAWKIICKTETLSYGAKFIQLKIPKTLKFS